MRKRFSAGLRLRFIAAQLVLVLLIGIAFAITIGALIEVLEYEMLIKRADSDLMHLSENYRLDPSAPPPQTAGMSTYIIPESSIDHLPQELRNLPPGIHDDVLIGAEEFIVGRSDVGQTRLYVLLDMTPVETLESRVFTFAGIWILTFSIAGALLALWMAGSVLRPVSELSAWVASLRPGTTRTPYAHHYGDADLDRVAERFTQYLDALDQHVARERAFTEDVSHELRTPLAVTRGAVTLLLDDDTLPATARRRIERIDRAMQQMQDLTEAILYLARDESATATPTAQAEIALEEVVTGAVEARLEAARHDGVAINIVELAPQRLRVPPGMVTSVIGNLLDNALHHARAGQVQLSLTPGQLMIEDSGVGIDPAQLPTLFDRRVRGQSSLGTGLGLNIVRRICEQQGWTLTVDSTPGAGTRFLLTFSSPAYETLTRT